MRGYQERIRALLGAAGRGDIDPRHIEGYMRLEHGTLDQLTEMQFAEEVSLCVDCVIAGGKKQAEKNAQSFGL